MKQNGKSAKYRAKGAVGLQDLKTTLLNDGMPFSVLEAYKSLRTNVMFSMPGSDCKIIGVTSASPGEGKSTTSANLALSLAQIGKRVLLIDCDMRIPTVASRFDIPATPGLSDFLVGQARIEETVRRHETYNLSILPSGNIPPDPTGLLEAKQLELLFTALRKVYEYVIIDLPPVTAVADPVILAKHIDGYVLVAREHYAEHRAVGEMLRQLRLVNARVLGFVSTCTESGGNPAYHR